MLSLLNLNISLKIMRGMIVISFFMFLSGCSVSKNISVGTAELAPSVSCIYEKKMDDTEVYGIIRTCRKIVKTTNIPYKSDVVFISKNGNKNINDFPFAIYEWQLSTGNPDKEHSMYDSPLPTMTFFYHGIASTFGIQLINKSYLIEKDGNLSLPFTDPFKYPRYMDTSVSVISYKSQNKIVQPSFLGKTVTDYLTVSQIHEQCRGKRSSLSITFIQLTEDKSYDLIIDCIRPLGTSNEKIGRFNCKTKDDCLSNLNSKYQTIIDNEKMFSDTTIPYYRSYKDWWINPSENPFVINPVQ